MPSGTDPQRRPVYIDRVNNRLLAEPLGAGPWPVVTVTSPAPTVPPGTLTQAGIVQLNDSTSSNSTTTAATPSAVKAAYDLAVSAGSKAATTSSAGIVQLTDSVSSTSTTTAATPNSVKTAYDKATTAGTTSTAGIVQLTDSISSTSTTTAATPNSVKSAYDLANAAIPKSLVDAKGDLLVASADNTVQRIAVGANTTVLTADSAAAAGVKWAAPATGAMVYISQVVVSTLSPVYTVSFTDLSFVDYVYFVLAISDYANPLAGYNYTLVLRPSYDNGASYGASGLFYREYYGNSGLNITRPNTAQSATASQPHEITVNTGVLYPQDGHGRLTMHRNSYDYNGTAGGVVLRSSGYFYSTLVSPFAFRLENQNAPFSGTFRLYGVKAP